MAFFVVPYVIHFDDTMAYGSHHFLTNFKFQCAGREHLLFSPHLFDVPEFKLDFDKVSLLTYEAYSRNLAPANLGDRLLVLTSVDERTDVGLRFCFRVVRADGEPISCGYQTILCADRRSGQVIAFPPSFAACFDALSSVAEAPSEMSFRDRLHKGGKAMRELFSPAVLKLARDLLSAPTLPSPGLVSPPTELAFPADATAFLFPGQGSLDLAALRSLISLLPELHGEIREIARVVTRHLGVDCEAFLFAPTDEDAQTWLSYYPDLDQVAIYCTGVLGAKLLERKGVRADVMLGHSFGEIAALAAAGAFDLRAGAEIVCHRILALAGAGTTGGLAAVSLGEQETRDALVAAGLIDCTVAGTNHARQTVVAGPPAELDRLRQGLETRGKSVTPVASRYAFHHPSLGNASERFARALADLSFRAPLVPVYSPIERSLYSGAPGEIRRALSSHLTRPFDFFGAVRSLHEAGVRHYRECAVTERLVRIVGKVVPANEGVTTEPLDLAHERSAPSSVAASLDSDGASRAAPVAIVSLGCVLPGGARDPEAYWDNMRRGVSGIASQEQLREDFFVAEGAPDKTYSLLAGLVHDADLLAPAGIETDRFDRWTRAQKLLAVALAQCVAALSKSVPDERTRCLIGSTADGIAEYDAALVEEALARLGAKDIGTRAISSSASLAPFPSMSAVVEALLGNRASTLLLDAACASSLYTLALGVHQLQQNEADLVLAGGVFSPGPGNSCLFAQFRGLSATGSKPFDASADGVIFGEGAGIVALKRLADAERDGDTIWAVIRGAGLSSDGKSSSANVPRSSGQVLAMERAYAASGIDPATVQYVEAHGTSTPAGDVTELESIARFFGDRTVAPLQLGSVKALLGHTGWAAGAASVIKLCLAFRAGILPAQHRFVSPNPRLAELADKGFQVRAVESAWAANGAHPRRAATSGFGFGGTNAHVILEEYRPSAKVLPAPSVPPAAASLRELAVVVVDGFFPNDPSELAKVLLPSSVLLLPDIAEDMDLTQRLALVLGDRVKRQLGERFAELRARTGIVLGLLGKTARGLEATQGVLIDSMARVLRRAGSADVADGASALVRRSCRRSGAYTLQGMMPNVTPGRVANVLDLNGPNFVVDAGPKSLYEALHAARLLLQDGCELVLVGAFEPSTSGASVEAAAIFAVTDPESAKRLGVTELCRLRMRVDDEGMPASRDLGARALYDAVAAARAGRSTTASLGGRPIEVLSVEASTSQSVEEAVTVEPSFGQDAAVGYYTPALVSRPIPLAAESWEGRRVLFLASDRELANELVKTVASRCRDFRVLVPSTAGATDSDLVRGVDLRDDVTEQLRFLEGAPPDRVVAITRFAPTASESDAVEMATRDRALVELLFLVSRSVYATLERGETRLATVCLRAVVRNKVLHPATGLYAGFVKSLAREVGPANAGSFCFEDDRLDQSLERLACEWMLTPDKLVEVIWGKEERWVRLLAPVRDTSRGEDRFHAHSVVLATGGARGVTAVLVEALLRRYGCTVVVLGRSDLADVPTRFLAASEEELDALETRYYAEERQKDPSARIPELRQRYARYRAANELRRTLDRFATLRGKLVYRACDITTASQVEAAVEEVRRTYGHLDLVVHGAGLQSSKRLDRRRLGEFRQNLDTKLLGLWNLYDACRRFFERPIPFHILTSAFSVMGNDGQADYGAANETLDRLCAFVTSGRDGDSWSSIGWLAWDRIGMTRSSEYSVLGAARGLRGIGAEEGQRLFFDVVASEPVHSINVQLTAGERDYYGLELAAHAPEAKLETRRIRIDSMAVPCLESHLVRGTPTLPGAWGLDLMLEAAAAGAGPDSVTIENVQFSRFVRVPTGSSQELRAQVARDGERVHVRLVGDLVHSSGRVLDRDRLYQEATFNLGARWPNRGCDVPLRDRVQSVQDPYCQPGGPLELSAPFSCLHDIVITPEGRRAKFFLSRDDVRKAGKLVPAMLLDAAWRLSAMHADGVSNAVYAPTRFERIGVLALPIMQMEDESLDLTLRALGPRVEGDVVHCTWVDAVNKRGDICLFVEGGYARRLN